MKKTLFAIFGMLVLAGCGGSGTTTSKFCDPNAEPVACDCPDGGTGKQYCLEDGSAYGMCMECPPAEDIPVTPDVVEDTATPDVAEVVEEVVPEVVEDLKDNTPQPEIVIPDVCLLNNCTKDQHCTDCSDGRNTCLVAENRCVACNPNTGDGCSAGETCTGWGLCAPTTLTCPTDAATNEPKVVCVTSADCKACSPVFQVCDPDSHKCVNCTSTNTSYCSQSDYCKASKCSPKCPGTCDTNADCDFCGPPENPLHACNKHKCAECSDSYPCPAGLICLANGSCYPPCGIPGPVQGTCSTDEDCMYCGDPKLPGTYVCNTPVNDPLHGSCQPPAEGCEDLGKGVAVLPEPWSDYTQLCSSDENCANVGATINLGKVIRDVAGVDEVAGIKIGDANVSYAMSECAEIKITENINCGVCVPCNEDSDCAPIALDSLIPKLFPEDALAQIAGILLIDMLWGDNPDHDLNFYCQPVALGYGVCAPCGNPTQPCGKTEPDPGTGDCSHKECETGGPLSTDCSVCVKNVCSYDAYCCTTAWDEQCVAEVDEYCATPCDGSGGCATDICTTEAPAQDPSCGECVAAVCEADAFCCNKTSGAWDAVCIEAAVAEPACAAVCGGGCAHDVCEAGGPLEYGCSDCVSEICDYDDYCCEYEWDWVCVEMTLDMATCPLCEEL